MLPELRRCLHVAGAEALHHSGALSSRTWFRRRLLRKDDICVLGLHRVLTKSEQERSNSLDGMIVREETYLALLAYLLKRFEVVSLDTLLAAEPRAVQSKPQCLITFDDGWADTYSHAFPALIKFGLPAVVFLTSGFIGARGGFWVEKVRKLWRTPARSRLESALRDSDASASRTDLEKVVEWLKYMPTERRSTILKPLLPDNAQSSGEEIDAMLTWDQAREMSDAGIEMGAHTVSHPLLTCEDGTCVARELQESKQTLEQELGKIVRAFAYPNGDWNERIREQVSQAGYGCAFTTRPSWHARGDNRYTISRLLLHEGNITARGGEFSPAMFDLTLAGWV